MTMRDEIMIGALKRERAAYVAQGKDDRVSQVDEQLKHYGYEAPDEATDTEGGPKGRRAPEATKQTATTKPAAQTAAQKRAGGGKD